MWAPRSPATSLFRQPHGFEGFRVIPEEFQVEDLALSNRRDRREFGRISWPLAHPVGDVPFDDAVSRVDPADRLATEEQPWLQQVLHRSHDDIGVVHLSHRTHVARVTRLITSFRQL